MENASTEQFSIAPADSSSARWERWLRRFHNFVVAKDIVDDKRVKAMMLQYAGEAVFELSEFVGVLSSDGHDQTKEKLIAYFTARRNEEYDVFTFRQAQQNAKEILDQFHARLQQLVINCNLLDKTREIRSQIIQKCAMSKIRDRGLSEENITLERLLTYGRTLESTIQQSLIICNAASATSNVNAVSSDRRHHPRSRKQSRDWNSHSVGRRSAPPNTDNQRKTHRVAPLRYSDSVSKYGNAQSCPGCGKPPHNRTECPAWGKTCYKCEKPNTNLVKDVPQQSDNPGLYNETYASNLYNCNATRTNTVVPYACTIDIQSTRVTMANDGFSFVDSRHSPTSQLARSA